MPEQIACASDTFHRIVFNRLIHPPDDVAALQIVDRGGGNFRVEEYKKPEFEVKVTAPTEPVSLGETITATITAKYYFGGAVAKGVTLTAHTVSDFQLPRLPVEPLDVLGLMSADVARDHAVNSHPCDNRTTHATIARPLQSPRRHSRRRR